MNSLSRSRFTFAFNFFHVLFLFIIFLIKEGGWFRYLRGGLGWVDAGLRGGGGGGVLEVVRCASLCQLARVLGLPLSSSFVPTQGGAISSSAAGLLDI